MREKLVGILIYITQCLCVYVRYRLQPKRYVLGLKDLKLGMLLEI